MKKLFVFTMAALIVSTAANSQFLKKLGDKIKDKTNQRVDQKTDKAVDKGLDKIDDATKVPANTNTGTTTTGTSTTTTTSTGTQTSPATVNTTAPVSYKAYANYDFVPGDKIIFEDNFSADADGEFATHWELQNGQGVVNKLGDKTAMVLTDGNYAWVSPLMKKKKYLDKEWTLEFDDWRKQEAYQLIVFLQDDAHHDLGRININADGVSASYLSADGTEGKDLAGSYPSEIQNENFYSKWHHVAIAYKNKQLKVYVNQSRVLVIPNSNIDVSAIGMGGIASPDGQLIFTNVRLAEGGGMNMLGKKFTDAKIITHGINFDVNKAIIKPESMGTLNGIVQILKDNPDVKFEVGGHTDSDGDDAGNLKLSQARADAVRNLLISMGVDAARLTAKGYGESKPIADNNTFEGKANNRRVEFVKL